MLLWEEIPVYRACDFKSKHTLEVAKSTLGELIVRDRNRASVVVWSVANETPESPQRSKFVKDLVKEAKKLDPSRPVAAAMFGERKGKTMTIKDALAKAVDIVGINEYIGWYEDAATAATAAATVKWKSDAKRPVVVSEFGASARAGLRGKVTERWTEDYQEALFKAQLDMAEKVPFLVGITPWILFDFRSPVRMNRHQQGYNRKGLVSDQGVRKLAFQVVRDRYEAWRKKYEGK
jgi:beta-glucuronidase